MPLKYCEIFNKVNAMLTSARLEDNAINHINRKYLQVSKLISNKILLEAMLTIKLDTKQ